MEKAPTSKRAFPVIATGFALMLAVIAAVVFFDLIQQSSMYVAAVRDQFYTPLAHPPHENWMQRALAPRSRALLRFALWPFLIFVALQSVGSYGFGRVFSFTGERVVLRRSIAGLATSLFASGLFLAALWPWLQSFVPR